MKKAKFIIIGISIIALLTIIGIAWVGNAKLKNVENGLNNAELIEENSIVSNNIY